MAEDKGPLTAITPERVAREVAEISGQRQRGEINATKYDQMFARMIQELRERKIEGSREEIAAAFKPLIDAGKIMPSEFERLKAHLGTG